MTPVISQVAADAEWEGLETVGAASGWTRLSVCSSGEPDEQ
jgi:hypothetical protein